MSLSNKDVISSHNLYTNGKRARSCPFKIECLRSSISCLFHSLDLFHYIAKYFARISFAKILLPKLKNFALHNKNTWVKGIKQSRHEQENTTQNQSTRFSGLPTKYPKPAYIDRVDRIFYQS